MMTKHEDREWKIAKYMSKAKAVYSPDKRPTYGEVADYVDQCEKMGKHITFPLTGEKWNQSEWQAQYEFGKTLNNRDLDISDYSSCYVTKCPKKLECKRGLLYLYLVDNEIIGHTVLKLTGEKNCKYFIPHCKKKE